MRGNYVAPRPTAAGTNQAPRSTTESDAGRHKESRLDSFDDATHMPKHQKKSSCASSQSLSHGLLTQLTGSCGSICEVKIRPSRKRTWRQDKLRLPRWVSTNAPTHPKQPPVPSISDSHPPPLDNSTLELSQPVQGRSYPLSLSLSRAAAAAAVTR